MTEEAKQTVLLLFREVLRHGESEAELQRFQDMHDKLLHDLSQEAASGLKTRLLAIPELLQGIMNVTRVKLAHTARIITFIEQTHAADLTKEAILAIR
jgi:hypothetical protein